MNCHCSRESKPPAFNDPRFTIAQLRIELRVLAASLNQYAPPPQPDRFERDSGKPGPEWHVPRATKHGSWDARLVRVITGEPEVFTEGGPYKYDGDMEAMTTVEARAYAMALLAAADWADGQDEIGQRRTAKGN